MNVFVTGGSRGIGRTIVLRFVSEGAGCAFTYAGNNDAADETIRLAKEANPDAVVKAYQLDVKNSESVDQTVEAAVDEFDTIDAVVNNAAVVRDNAAVVMSDEEWLEVIEKDFRGDDEKYVEASVELITKAYYDRNWNNEEKWRWDIDGFEVYSHDYFYPYDHLNGTINMTENTITFHFFQKSWTK